ncbi:hypothetical protein [uncultured Solobacterium sp.]|nr:hypothetical protein [uncultured Solobacterium sp.]
MDSIFKLDATNLPNREKYKKMIEFIAKLVGQEAIEEIFGTEDLDEMDLNDITLAIFKVRDAYENPLANYQAEKSSEELSRIPLDKLQSFSKLMDSVSKVKK